MFIHHADGKLAINTALVRYFLVEQQHSQSELWTVWAHYSNRDVRAVYEGSLVECERLLERLVHEQPTPQVPEDAQLERRVRDLESLTSELLRRIRH